MSSLVSSRKRSSACRVLFPEHIAPAKTSSSSSEMRIQPVLMPRKRKALETCPNGPNEAVPNFTSAPQLQQPSTSQHQQLQQKQQAPPPLQQQSLPSFTTSFTSLLYAPAPVYYPAVAPVYVHTDYSTYYSTLPYFPMNDSYATLLCTQNYYRVVSSHPSCFYTPEPYAPNPAKRGCY
ncbi:hypothetical protein PMAYCL1PPCAC_30148 [Pristionchus mayeri]|uniref:Uncharacterized protein n=1 Tax=Pristionchus mayeri TaxID=1317129 RepID=A0AAN5IBG2_9BILA|nr:hypothetical protein PMAYCL1PPCAC_30148 [Pristionchus mayeri]